MQRIEWRDLTTYALGIAAGACLFGAYGAGIVATCFCLARIYAAMRKRGRG